MYEYRALVESCHDGDTCTVLLDQGLKEFRRMNIRLAGINAPELRTAEGPPSRAHLLELLGPLPASVVVRTLKDQADKYGERWEGRIWPESAGLWGPDNQFITAAESLNQRMVADGFAAEYNP